MQVAASINWGSLQTFAAVANVDGLNSARRWQLSGQSCLSLPGSAEDSELHETGLLSLPFLRIWTIGKAKKPIQFVNVM